MLARQKYKTIIRISVLAVGFVYCIYHFIVTVKQVKPAGKRTILIAHWQGERGCKESLQKIIDEYNKLHPETYIKQQIIVGHDSSFVRWCVTQIIGGTPPDIMQYHGGFRSYLSNYFVGLGQYVKEPNPYNQTNEYKKIPWKDTFYGGMYGNWESELMDYYSIPNTLYTRRFFYNKEIFRHATGSDAPPKNMAEFIDICRKIERLGIIPVIVENATGHSGVVFFNMFFSQVGWELENNLDFNHDGLIQSDEFMRAFYLNSYKLSGPRFDISLEMLNKFSTAWGKGFNSIDFTIAPFMFIQQKGACYFGGSWLGRQMLDSCKFELGSFSLPLITAGSPIAGKYYCGPWGENMAQPGMSLAVAKGANQDAAIDFLRFLTNKKNNSSFNAGPAWVPGVIGAAIDPAVKNFKPCIRGKMISLDFFCTRSVMIEFKRITQNYLAGTCSLDKAVSDLTTSYKKYGMNDNLRASRDSLRRLLMIEGMRDRIENELLNTNSSCIKTECIKRLKTIYETQTCNLNIVYSTFGTVAVAKGEMNDQ